MIIVAVILMIFGSGTMLSFGYSLLTGVVLNFLCGVVTSKLMMKSLGHYPKLCKPRYFDDGRQQDKIYPFYKNRKKFFLVSLILFAIGVGCISVSSADAIPPSASQVRSGRAGRSARKRKRLKTAHRSRNGQLKK